jgi:hypothetical protein
MTPNQVPTGLVDAKGQLLPSQVFAFFPMSDITALEVAQAVTFMGIAIPITIFEQMPKNVQRHFVRGDKVQEEARKTKEFLERQGRQAQAGAADAIKT